jgi:hypothetical protein
MAEEPQPDKLSRIETTDQPEVLNFPTIGTPDQLANLDVKKLKVLFELQEAQRAAEFERQFRQREFEHQRDLQLADNAAKGRKADQELYLSKLHTLYKIGGSAATLILGTILITQGYADIGFFLTGGGLTVITTDAAKLMQQARRK